MVVHSFFPDRITFLIDLMIPREILKKVRQIEIRTKKFTEERELTVMLLVDVSASGHFGSGQQSKNELAAELAALLAFSAIRNNDKVGLIMFTDRIEKYVAPQKGRRHVLRVVREILAFVPAGTGTDVALAIDYLQHVQHRQAVCFLLSDFQVDGSDRLRKKLRVAARRHDLIALSLSDPREEDLPALGLIDLQDAETGEQVLLDTSHEPTRHRFAADAARQRQELQALLRTAGVDQVEIRSDGDYLPPLLRCFRRREQRR